MGMLHVLMRYLSVLTAKRARTSGFTNIEINLINYRISKTIPTIK